MSTTNRTRGEFEGFCGSHFRERLSLRQVRGDFGPWCWGLGLIHAADRFGFKSSMPRTT